MASNARLHSTPCLRRRAGRSLIAALAALVMAAVIAPGTAGATSRQVAIIQDGGALQSNPLGTLQTFRMLGATTLRVLVIWYDVAPHPGSLSRPSHFNASDPGAYPAANWASYDSIVRLAQQQGFSVDLDVAGGSPVWADAKGSPVHARQPHFAWKPSAREYGQFVTAISTRYNGRYTPKGQTTPLPRVNFWSLWNEPNFGQDLGPQAIDGSTVSVAPAMYRGLVDAGWRSLHQTGHGSDTILIGEFAAEGRSGPVTRSHPQGLPGDYAQTKPLQFLRTLYCVDTSYQPLRGRFAALRGCPTNTAGTRQFRAAHPGLFLASGVGNHPYSAFNLPVDTRPIDPDYAIFSRLGAFERTLDRLQRVYGSGKRYQVYSTEYGYITRPPKPPPYPTQVAAANDLNWAEYVSYKSPRIGSYAQYLLKDPIPAHGSAGFASGLYSSRGQAKLTFYAYRMPLFMPQTTILPNSNVEVWGGARPAHFANLATRKTQSVQVQYQANGQGGYRGLRMVSASSLNGYIDTHVRLSSSGRLRLAYTYPQNEPFMPFGYAGRTIYSRVVNVTVR